VSALVNDAAPLPLGPLNGPDWVVPEMLNEPYIVLSPNGATVPPTTLPAAMLLAVVALVSFWTVFHLMVIVPVDDDERNLVKHCIPSVIRVVLRRKQLATRTGPTTPTHLYYRAPRHRRRASSDRRMRATLATVAC
jgi:hypothetical protein